MAMVDISCGRGVRRYLQGSDQCSMSLVGGKWWWWWLKNGGGTDHEQWWV